MRTRFLQAHLFGVFDLLQQGEGRILPPSTDARRLLAYLILHPQPQARLALAGKLWPELPEANARHALRQALWHLNRVLPGLVVSEADRLSLCPGDALQVDVAEFEALVNPYLQGDCQWPDAARDLSCAVAMYADLLDGYYDDWAIVERERLRERYLQALEKLIVAYKATLRYEQALSVALQLAAAHPLSESAHREVMRLYHSLGNPAAALKQYRLCQEILEHELGVPPDGDTARLAQAIAGPDMPLQLPAKELPYLPRPTQPGGFANGQGSATIPLVGRNAERDALAQWLRQGAGPGSLILVEGEAGVGKTRLLQETARDAAWHGYQVLWGKAAPLENGKPLGVLVEALESQLSSLRVEQLQRLVEPLWLRTLQPVLPALSAGLADLPELPPLEAEHARNRLIEALGGLLAAWARIVPLVVILEDVHWADADTFTALLRLPPHLEGANLSLIASYRGEETPRAPRLAAWLGEMASRNIRGRLKLAPLDRPATRELILAALGGGAITPCFEEALFTETRGAPLFVLETLRSLADEGVLRQGADGNWQTPYDCLEEDFDLPLPASVEQVILRRLEQLPPAVWPILEAMSALGSRFDFKQLDCLELAEAASLLAAIQELLRRRLLEETLQDYHFHHDKIRQSVYENLPEGRRLGLHCQIGLALEKHYPHQVEALAHHFFAGQSWQKAVFYQQEAARKALAVFAYAHALSYLDRATLAAAQVEWSAAEHFELLRRREEVLEILGQRDAQGRDLEQMALLASGDPRRLNQVRRRQAYLMFSLNRFDEADAAGRDAVELARGLGDARILAESLIVLAEITGLSYSGRYADAFALVTEAAPLCEQAGDLRLAAELHRCAASLNFSLPPNTGAVDEGRQALALYRQLGDKLYEGEAASLVGNLLQTNGADLDQAIHYQKMALDIGRAIGYRMLEARMLNNLANIYATLDLNRALENYDRAAAILRSLNDERRAAITWLNAAHHRLLLLGDSPVTKPAIDFSLEYARRAQDRWVEGYALLLAGTAARLQGDLPGARNHLLEARAAFEFTKTPWLHTQTCILLAAVEQESGRLDPALANLAIAAEAARASQWVAQLAFIQARQAALWLQQGDTQRAAGLVAQAMEGWTPTMEYAWEIPFTRYRVAKTLGHPEEAQQALEQAYHALEKTLGQLTPEQRALSCRHIPLHRLILDTWQATQPHLLRVRLPRREAAGRRPAGPEAEVEVVWTLALPGEGDGMDKVSLRRQRLRRLLQEAAQQGARPTQEHLAQALKVSLRTIAQDIASLQDDPSV